MLHMSIEQMRKLARYTSHEGEEENRLDGIWATSHVITMLFNAVKCYSR